VINRWLGRLRRKEPLKNGGISETIGIVPVPWTGIDICGLAFSPDGKRLAVIYQEYMINIWDLSSTNKAGQTK
jgi:WD40 repeat protein